MTDRRGFLKTVAAAASAAAVSAVLPAGCGRSDENDVIARAAGGLIQGNIGTLGI